ncbi:MAG: thioesterase domain-containing protein [Xenococcaceae cyanobacterium MO_188.B32]|nr:thioesterase domain-containing protein [Xenococcaceae cyanobacterium MO_188.B32]
MNLDCKAVEHYLHEHIPLAQVMAVSVESIDESLVILSAPLAPNINHRNTAFGGSISTLAILSAWTFVHVRLQALSIPCRIVIHRNNVEYIRAIENNFQSRCIVPPQAEWKRFIKTVSQRGKGRIVLDAEVYSEGLLAAKFQGEYVALKLESTIRSILN